MPKSSVLADALATAWRPSVDVAANFSVAGSSATFAPLVDAPNASRLNRYLDAARLTSALEQHTPVPTWCNAQRARELRVSIIGISVTAGCGAARGQQRCSVQLGWARRLADAYQRLAALVLPTTPSGAAARAQWNVWPRNAAPLRFWLQCTTSSFELTARTNVVLVETEATLAASDQHELRQLVRAIRRGAPNAVIGFVLWPTQRQLAQERGPEQMVRRMAASEGFDAISASTLLDEATRAGEPASAFYGDLVHPNIDGHAMLAGLTSAWLLGNLVPAVSRCASLDEHGKQALEPGLHEGLSSSPPSPPPSFELCYARADDMPAIKPQASGWQLLDGGRAKGVVKMGYVSTRPGNVLRLGPLLPEVRCGLFDVSLGYLRSWRREQGALYLSCSGGCICSPMYRWQKARDHEPFPELQTWTHARSASVDGALANASITAYARFLLAKVSSDACTINVAHNRTESTAAGASSRVRVDSLSLKLSSCATHCVAMRHASGDTDRSALGDLRQACTAGMKQGRAGFHAPRCAGCEDVESGDPGSTRTA